MEPNLNKGDWVRFSIPENPNIHYVSKVEFYEDDPNHPGKRIYHVKFCSRGYLISHDDIIEKVQLGDYPKISVLHGGVDENEKIKHCTKDILGALSMDKHFKEIDIGDVPAELYIHFMVEKDKLVIDRNISTVQGIPHGNPLRSIIHGIMIEFIDSFNNR